MKLDLLSWNLGYTSRFPVDASALTGLVHRSVHRPQKSQQMSDISRLISRSWGYGHLQGRPCLCSAGTKLNGSLIYDPVGGRSVCFRSYPEASYNKGEGKVLRGKGEPELCCSFMKTSESQNWRESRPAQSSYTTVLLNYIFCQLILGSFESFVF